VIKQELIFIKGEIGTNVLHIYNFSFGLPATGLKLGMFLDRFQILK